jgi:hypothetical protein
MRKRKTIKREVVGESWPPPKTVQAQPVKYEFDWTQHYKAVKK